MTFYDLTEDWCCGVKELQHDREKNKRFYICDGFLGMTDFMRDHQPEKSPCVLADSSLQGLWEKGYDDPMYTVYFAVRATEANDDRAALVARQAAKALAAKFIAYLRWLKNNRDASADKGGSQYSLMERREQVARLDVERISYDTVGPFYEGWHAVFVMLECPVMAENCLSESDYMEGFL
jgi:hypothetical protein